MRSSGSFQGGSAPPQGWSWPRAWALAGSLVLLTGQTDLPAQEMPTLRFPASPAPSVRRSGEPTSVSRQVNRPLPAQIVALPGVQEELEIIHRRSQLVVARSNVVRTAIADPSVIEVVQFSPNEIAIIGLTVGTTTLTLWFDNSPEPLIYLVRTIRDPDLDEQRRLDYGKLERKLAVLFPNSQVFLIPVSGKIVVKGQARDPEEAARILQIIRGEVINQEGSLAGPQPTAAGDPLTGAGQPLSPFDLASSAIVNMLEVPGEQQVMLKVRIAELSRAQLRRMGVNLEFLLNGGRHAVATGMGGAPSTFTGIFENGEIGVLINWLAANGTVKILSEPTLTVLSGHPASFLAGGEFAVPTIIGIDGAQGQGTTFRGFGTSILVTPTVIDRDLVRMRIVPEFSEVNMGTAVGGIPGVDARRVQTTVQLRQGQTIAIAGLFAHRSDVEVTRIPLLGEIPWIGPRLMAGKRATMDETELLILVTPELVRPMDADEVPPVPGFYVTPTTDDDLYKRAMTEGAPDTNVYQLAPYGRGNGIGLPVGYRLHDPAPASPMYAPVPTDPYGWGVPAPDTPHSMPGPAHGPHGSWPPVPPEPFPHHGQPWPPGSHVLPGQSPQHGFPQPHAPQYGHPQHGYPQPQRQPYPQHGPVPPSWPQGPYSPRPEDGYVPAPAPVPVREADRLRPSSPGYRMQGAPQPASPATARPPQGTGPNSAGRGGYGSQHVSPADYTVPAPQAAPSPWWKFPTLGKAPSSDGR